MFAGPLRVRSSTFLEQLKWFCALVVLILVFSPNQASAQLSSASVTGVVRDSSGSLIPQAKITLRNVNTAVEHSTQSNSAGNYVFLSITPGQYTLQAEAAGFEISKISEFT